MNKEMSKEDIVLEYMIKGNRCIAEENYAEAIDVLTKVIELEPDNYNAYANRGNAKAKIGNPKEGLKDYIKAIMIEPNDGLTYYNAGCLVFRYLHGSGEYFFSKAIELDPDNPERYLLRGLMLYHFRLYEYAIDDFSKCIELNPEDEQAYSLRGDCYMNLEDYDSAIADFKVIIDKNDVSGYKKIGEIKQKQGLLREALTYYYKALEYEPDNTSLIKEIADINFELHEYEETIRYCDKRLEINPLDIKAYWEKGCCNKELGNYREAIADIDKAILYGLKNYEYHLKQGDCYYILQDYEKAKLSYQKADELEPDNETINNSLSLADYMIKEKSNAE